MLDRWRRLAKILSVTCAGCSAGLLLLHQVRSTYMALNSIVKHDVLELQKKHTAEYVYIDDPAYELELTQERSRERGQWALSRLTKSLKHSLQWRLLWLCKHGNRDQRNGALEKLAAFNNNKDWDCLKLAQAMDMQTAVLLARTKGADVRYFLPAPLYVRRAARSPALVSFALRDLMAAAVARNPHICIKQFLAKHFVNVAEHAVDADHVPAKPDSISERELCLLCLDALDHHLSLFYGNELEEDQSSQVLVHLGLLPKLAELFLRYRNDTELDYAILKILIVLSCYKDLLKEFHQCGLIRELARLVKSKDIRLASSAAVVLANLSGEVLYKPGLYLLHPLYRTRTPFKCDLLLVHGLRGGVFVTWRQRDKKCAEPVGFLEVTMLDSECDACEEQEPVAVPYFDPELKQVMEDLRFLEDQTLLSDYEIVLHDLPLEAKRETANTASYYTSEQKLKSLTDEAHDQCHRTQCWPRDWLPQDCDNLRVLGINYWSSLSDWLERCPWLSAEIATKATELSPHLIDAGVGKKDRPIIWLAHSMGGLIVKQILIEAAQSSDKEDKQICNNTQAIVFFSTPHKGSSMAKMPRPAAAILWPSRDVRQLEENSPFLLELHHNFTTFADLYEWETISFAETLPTLITAFKVPVNFVEATSADAERGVFYRLPLDHLAICKPATRQSVIYTTVLNLVRQAVASYKEDTYTHPFILWILNILLKIFSITPSEESEGLTWLEQVLLDTFTDF